jgi:hypothetical protein
LECSFKGKEAQDGFGPSSALLNDDDLRPSILFFGLVEIRRGLKFICLSSYFAITLIFIRCTVQYFPRTLLFIPHIRSYLFVKKPPHIRHNRKILNSK